ncbi:MAG: preprotein translocase subunit SecB [Arenicella sp.]|jgi:preprotein translocase subunit SecB
MAEEQAKQNTFDIRKIYVKDISVESPNAPGIFLRDPGTPEVSVDASIKASKLEQEGFYEVTLGMTITSKMAEEMAFLVEVQQAGVFHILGLPDADLPLALEIACPNILLPFAREAVSDLVGKAGFPQLLLSPINFEGLYQQKLQQKAASESEPAAEDVPQQ